MVVILSNNQLDQSQADRRLERGTLPPRHIKHGKKKPESAGEESNREETGVKKSPSKAFSFIIQSLFWSLFLFIFAIFGFAMHRDGNLDWLFKPPTEPTIQMETGEPKDKQDSDADNGGVDGEDMTESEEENVEQIDQQTNENNKEADKEEQAAENEKEEQKKEEEVKKDEAPSSSKPAATPKVIKEHVVQPGETFYRITVNYYGSSSYQEYLAKFNNISDTTQIQAGTKLKIPEKP